MEISGIQVACVSGCYLEEPSTQICEIQCTCDIKDLYYFILDSFDFDDDHLHEFFISGSFRNRSNTIKDSSTTLSEIFPLGKNQNLFLNFDFGDDWMFKIKRTRRKAQYNDKISYPRVIEHLGKNPKQYPMYDDYN